MRLWARRALAPVVELREGESTTAVLLFAYSFLAMTAYNIIKPITRSKFISDLGADNLPWVQLAAGILIGLIMQLYSRAIARVPRRWAIPVTQAGVVVILLGFWVLFTAGYQSASVAFYVVGLILGILLISQFWTLANDIYDARQAKRLFGFIGGGSSLGGASGAAITALLVSRTGTVNLLLVSAAVMLACLVLVIAIVKREQAAGAAADRQIEEGVGGGEAITMLRQSRHLQIIAVVIGCAAMGGAIIEQQLNMAAAARLGAGATDGITAFLAQVTVYLSLIGFVIQVAVTSRVHRLLGLGFALMILPVSLGMTGGIMLVNAGLWAPALARVLDTSLRYTVDKTTREILFLPLPAAIKYRAKPFVDVTMDRFAKALGALTILVLIKPWGLALTWQQLSWASLTLTAVWIVMAVFAKREYLAVFRRSIERQDVEPADLRAPGADLETIETLIGELADPDEARVLYAIALLESLDKRQLVTPLLLHHSAPRVRARTLETLVGQSLDARQAGRWLPSVERLLADTNADVRTAAVRAVAALQGNNASAFMRRYLSADDPRLVVTAAAALGASLVREDAADAEAAFERLLADTREGAPRIRHDIAEALGELPAPAFRRLLVPLLLDPNVDVARAAIRSARRLMAHAAPDSALFVPALVARLGHRALKEDTRSVLVGYGEGILDALAYFLRDEDEQLWVRRHLPAVLAAIPCARSVEILIDALPDRDEFLRDRVILALDAIRRTRADLAMRREPIEQLILDECRRLSGALTLHANFCDANGAGPDTLLTQALTEKVRRLRRRIFLLLGLIYPREDVIAARRALDGDGRVRASASEYLDNVLQGALRKRVMLIVEDMPREERIRRINLAYRTRRRDVEDTLAQLVHDDDQVLAAAAIHAAAASASDALVHDFEFVLANRHTRDWYVFEAASWALARSRAGAAADTPDAKWLEALPAVEIANRLRHVPLFAHVGIDELFRLAGMGRQMRHGRGRTICAVGNVPDALHLLIDGEVTSSGDTCLQAPAALAFDEVMGERPVTDEIRAASVAATMSLTTEDWLTLLSNNVELAEGLFRTRLDSAGGATRPLVLPVRAPLDGWRQSATGLTAVERVLLLRASAVFALATEDEMLALAAVAREVPLTTGRAIAPEAGDAAIHIVVSGGLSVEVDGTSATSAGPGDTVGAYEMLTATRTGERVTVTTPGSALKIDRAAFFNLLADRVRLLQHVFSALPRGE